MAGRAKGNAVLLTPDTRPNAVVAYCPVASMHENRRGFPREPYPNLMPAPEADAPDLYRRASVEDRIPGAEPPMLFIHGSGDETVSHTKSIDLCRQINDAGGAAEIEILPGVEHGFGYGVESDAQKRAVAFAEQFLAERL